MNSRALVSRHEAQTFAAPAGCDLWARPAGQPALIRACAYVDSEGMDEITILQAEVLKTLANPRRLEIVHVLANGPIEVGRLAEAIGATQPNVSQHLAMLRAAGIVEAELDGREVRYRLADPDVIVASGVMRGVLERRLRRLADLAGGSDVVNEAVATRLPADQRMTATR
jgi:DNA-binding transcriptional ArsR family regulator